MMDAEDIVKRREAAAEEFNRSEGRTDGPQLVGSLNGGLTILRDSLYARIRDDVQRRHGMDSMLVPMSPEKMERTTKIEIELYQIAVSTVTTKDRRYVKTADNWYLEWASRFRLGRYKSESRVAKRLADYLTMTPDERRLTFSNILAKAVPESRQAPLVLFRLMPFAVQIATALAFGKRADAQQWRAQQTIHLPGIHDCHECRGKLLDNGEQCAICGNPLWKFEWLTTVD